MQYETEADWHHGEKGVDSFKEEIMKRLIIVIIEKRLGRQKGKGKRIGRKSAIQGWKRVSEPLKGGAEMEKVAVKRRETKKRPGGCFT